MASTTSVPIEQAQVKPSFAKVAASAYKPQNTKELPLNAKPQVMSSQPAVHLQSSDRSYPSNGGAPKVRIDSDAERESKEKAGNTATRTGQWANSTGHQVAFEPGSKEEEPEKARPSVTLIKSLATEDSTTQLSSSDGSAKPPSLDGKSVASATTFALDEKESIRPDDSASLRAVEEEDVTSPPDSVATGSRVGSDSGVARAFRDQLHEIAVMGPLPQRGAPPGRIPNSNVNSSHTLYDPNQPPNGIVRPMSQPVVNGMPNMTGPHNMPAIPDEKLIEALESPRDRLFVLKLEQDFIDFVKDSKYADSSSCLQQNGTLMVHSENELSLPNCNTFYRMLAHRLADYYLLGHVVDNTMTGVKITRTPYCRIPPPLSGYPVSSKNANTPPVDLPARKIMRRGDDAKSGTNTTANSESPSKTASEAGNDSQDTESKDKSAMTREEREARYREARQRIFGNSENEEIESTEAVGSGEEKDVSRSSSASGKKKNKKQRNYDDDGFEARSRFNAYYPQQYPVPGYTGDGTTMFYGGYPGQMQNTQYPAMGANASPPPTYNGGYSVMMPQDAQSHYGWPGQQYQPSNGPMGYPNYGAVQNGYDLSADFQRGMQSFQSGGIPSQATPKMANAPMASYQDTYQPQNMPMNPGWQQMASQPPYHMGQPPFSQNGPGNRPMSAPIQGPVPGPYPYGQFPGPTYNAGKPNRNQHPLPGSFNRQQFNPQSQTFIPGGRNMPFQMQPNMPQMPPQGMSSYGNFQMPVANQMSNQMPRPSPPIAHPQTFGSPRGLQNSNPLPTKVNNAGPSQGPQIASSQTTLPPPTSSQSGTSSVPAQSSIAKWGTPSHLPPKPPPPAQAQPPKFNLPGHNFPSIPRLSNNMAPGFPANAPIIRGGAGPSMPNNNTT
ncbi:hypothetical protein K469DRAFT_162779 [Zopfia rhizophila CBS 207.26]|uniref:SUZ domain-containing protein n=1 Tax=Zopfia rhizophila CBS 207.26 TaxID=1314779 RepID=A0A6A6E4V6_9PEZI|nr:hypothetical protein K469DRAFT_162779 [Zopfia rhizophila CBS 207.26]